MMDKVKEYAEEFMEKEYSDEAPYFHIAWEIFEEVLQDTEGHTPDLKGPIVRFEGDDTIMAPVVIRAFYTIFSKFGEEIDSTEDTETLKSSIREILSKNKFSHEFSVKIVDFIFQKSD